MTAKIFIEGGTTGPRSKFLQVRCREGFHKLLAGCGLPRQPALKACGSRAEAYRFFAAAWSTADPGDSISLLVDSEDPVADPERTWEHLNRRDGWKKPEGADDRQVLLMTTCMETWITSDRRALRKHYGANLQVNALPSLHDMESRDRRDIQEALAHSTRHCRNRYQKGARSFEILGKLDPEVLCRYLPGFVRCVRILRERL